jgi:hypothetical protein
MEIITTELTNIVPELTIDKKIKLLESELHKYKDIVEKNKDIINFSQESKVDIESIEPTQIDYELLDKEHELARVEQLYKSHNEDIKAEYPNTAIIKLHNLITAYIKPIYKSKMYVDIYRCKIVSCQMCKIKDLLCVIYINVYGDCFGYLGLIEKDNSKLLFKFYPFPDIDSENIIDPNREIMPKELCEQIKKNKSLYFIATDSYNLTYNNTGTYMHIKPKLLGRKNMNFFGSIKLLNIWSIKKRRLFVKNETERIIASKEINNFTIEELDIIQENILFQLKKYNIMLNLHNKRPCIEINYASLAIKLKRFKIFGFFIKEEKHIASKYNTERLIAPSLFYRQNKKICPKLTEEVYYYDKITINYIDIYGNNYNSVFNTRLEPSWDNLTGNYDYGKYLYLVPFVDYSHNGTIIECNPIILLDLIERKQYINKQNIYQEYLFDKSIADGKIIIKDTIINYIKSKLESNDDFDLFYTYITEQILLTMKFTSGKQMYEQFIEYFENVIDNCKLKLFKYAKIKAIGITDPSYIEISSK